MLNKIRKQALRDILESLFFSIHVRFIYSSRTPPLKIRHFSCKISLEGIFAKIKLSHLERISRIIEGNGTQEKRGVAIAVEIYEEIRQCREIYGYGQRQTARLLKISRNTVKKYWKETTVPWERKQDSWRKNDVLTDEHLKFIDECLEEDKLVPKKTASHSAQNFHATMRGKWLLGLRIGGAGGGRRAQKAHNNELCAACLRACRGDSDILGRNNGLFERQ